MLKDIYLSIYQVAKQKGNEQLMPWIKPVVNHFWYCAEKCEGSAVTLMVGS